MTTILHSPESRRKTPVIRDSTDEEKHLTEVIGYIPTICINTEFKDIRDFIHKTKSSNRHYPSYCARDYREAYRQLEQLKGEYQVVSFVHECITDRYWYLYRDESGNITVRIRESKEVSQEESLSNNLGLLKLNS